MKKILLFILLFAGLITKAQFPNTVTGGNSSTLNKQLGAYGANLGYVWTAAYSDTTAANLSFIKNVPGIVIRIGNDLWMRSANVLVWIKISGGSSNNIYNTDGILQANRTLTGLNQTYGLSFDSLNTFIVWRNAIPRIGMNNIQSGLFSPNGLNSTYVSDAVSALTFNNNANYLWMLNDSSLLHKRLSYEGNIHSTFNDYSLVDKKYADSITSTANNFANANLTQTGDRTYAGAGFDYDLNNLGDWAFNMANNEDFYVTNAGFVGLYSESNNFFLGKAGSAGVYVRGDSPNLLTLSAGSSFTRRSEVFLAQDSIAFTPGGNGKINIDSLRSATDTVKNKPMVWNVDNGMVSRLTSWPSGGGSGTPGGSNKQVQYNNSSAFGGYTGFEVGNTNNDVLITAGATTSVPLNIKLQSSQTANALNISSSSGTGDLLKVNSAGEILMGGVSDAGDFDLQTTKGVNIQGYNTSNFQFSVGSFLMQSTALNNGFMTDNMYYNGSNWTRPSPGYGYGFQFYNGQLLMHGVGSGTGTFTQTITSKFDYLGNFGIGNSLDFYPGSLIGANFYVNPDGYVRLKEISAPATPASGYSSVYVKSDGLFYGKDDAGTETKLSNTLSGFTQSKGVTLETPTSAENFGLWKTQVDITISSINAVVIGSSPSVTINIAFGSNITSLTNVFSSGTAITNTTTGQTINSGFNDATIPAGSWIRLISTAQSGTVTQIEVTINYTQD